MKAKRLLKRLGKQNALKSSKRGILAGNSKDCSQVVIPLGDDAELIHHLEYDENDEALQEAARIFEEYKRGEGHLHDLDFIKFD